VDTRTLIEPFFDLEGPVGSLLNSAIVLVTFAVPLPLFLRLSPYYLVVAVFLLVLWFMFARAVHLSSAESRTDPRWARLVALVLSLTVVQSVFEPDYGSYVRHLTPLLPLMLAVILWRPRAFGGADASAPQTAVRVPGDAGAEAEVPSAAR
jgi:purine-cytosine permease-like protein